MGAAQTRLSELALRLVKLGWQVDVLTALPNYPTGEIFEGWPRVRARVCFEDGVRVVRLPLWPSQQGMVRRLATYTSFAASAAAWGARLVGHYGASPPDLIWVESPPLFLVGAAVYLARCFGCPYVMNVSDLWPESAAAMGMLSRQSLPYRGLAHIERWAYRHAAGITGQSDETIEHIAKIIPNTPRMVLTNGVDLARFAVSVDEKREARRWLCAPFQEIDAALDKSGEGDPVVFVYAGLMGHAQGLEQIFDVAAKLPPQHPARFVLIGDGPMRAQLVALESKQRVPRVAVLEAQKREQIPKILAAADVAFVSLGMQIVGAVPSKIYEAMAAQIPILLLADPASEAARRVLAGPWGQVVAPGDQAGVLEAVLQYSRPNRLQPQVGEDFPYNRDALAGQLSDFLQSI